MTIDYSPEYTDVPTDSGTWATAEDGSLILTGTARDFTADAADNGNGTVTYTMEVTNLKTGIVCAVSGMA